MLSPNGVQPNVWSTGRAGYGHDDLWQLLLASAQSHARRALGGFTSEEQDEMHLAAISAGCAVEMLAKSYLVRINPLLIADPHAKVETRLRLAGHAEHTSGIGLQTIGLEAAIDLAKHYLAELRHIPQKPVVSRVRNAAAHMGLVDETQLHDAVVQMVQVARELLSALAIEGKAFWGADLFGAANALSDTATVRKRQVIEAKLAAASAKFAALVDGLDVSERKALLLALSGRQKWRAEYNEQQSCPVCHLQGWLLCDVEYEADEDGAVSAVAYPYRFECATCGLTLIETELTDFEMDRPIDPDPFDIEVDEVYEADEVYED